MAFLDMFLAAAEPHPLEVVVTVRDLVYFGAVFTVVVGVVVEARIRIAMLWSKTKTLEKSLEVATKRHNECADKQTARYDEIKELLHGIKRTVALTRQRVNFLVQSNGGTVPDDEDEE